MVVTMNIILKVYKKKKKMPSLDNIYDFDAFTLGEKKVFVDDIIQEQIAFNSSGLGGNLFQAMIEPLVGTFGSLVIQTIIILKLLTSINVDRIASELRGKMTVKQIFDFIVSTTEF